MSSSTSEGPFEGGCTCRQIRYTVRLPPIYVHACHCRYCQRETGSAFALNAMYEAAQVTVTTPTQPELVETPTHSGKPQTIARCPSCKVAVWSTYRKHGAHLIRVIRVGTFDEPGLFPPGMHVYTSTKQPWLYLREDIPSVPEFYHIPDFWPKEKLDRLNRVLQQGGGSGFSANDA